MALNKDQLVEINELLKDKKLEVPDFRRTIGPGGQNGQWIKKKLLTHPRNANAPQRLKDLIALI